MKVCPRCQKTYADENLNFCLDDGTALKRAPGAEPPATVLLNQPRVTAQGGSSGFGQQVAQPAAWNTGQQPNYAAAPAKKSSKTWIWVLLILGGLILLCGGGFVGALYYVGSQATQIANAIEQETNRASNTKSKVTPSPAPVSGRTKIDKLDLAKWVQTDKSYGDTDYSGGELTMSARKTGFYYVLMATADKKTGSADTRVTVKNTSGDETTLGYGLVFHSNPTPLQKGYAFLIDSERKRFRVVNHLPKKEDVVIGWTDSEAVLGGTAENKLEVRDNKDNIDLYINGEKVTSIRNVYGYPNGVVGLYVADQVKVAFRDLEIRK